MFLFDNYKRLIRLSYNVGLNLLSDLYSNQLTYVVESAAWSINMDAYYITKNLNRSGLIKARTSNTYKMVYNQIVHFGSINTFVTPKKINIPDASNKIVVTWFHITPGDDRLARVVQVQDKIQILHTSTSITKKELIEQGFAEDKIRVIPLGVDTDIFQPSTQVQRRWVKRLLGIPQDKVVIGSFQKDGVGWDKGLEPKLIKGPDIFVEAVKRLRDYPVFVLLVGPARGYVEKELRRLNIPFKSIGYIKDFSKIPLYYKALDMYVIPSRKEGGPKQILEAWASGVPVVSTRVGMVIDIAENEKDILLSDVEDVDGLARNCARVIEDQDLKIRLVNNALDKVTRFSWERIAKRYYEEIYREL